MQIHPLEGAATEEGRSLERLFTSGSATLHTQSYGRDLGCGSFKLTLQTSLDSSL